MPAASVLHVDGSVTVESLLASVANPRISAQTSSPATISDLLGRHLEERRLSAKAFADQVDISYPSVLAVLSKGRIPRSTAHRERLRTTLGIEAGAWAEVVVASSHHGCDLGGEAPNLGQLVLRAMLELGQTEQSLAQASGVAYPTILGVTRKGAIPREATLAKLAESLGLESDRMTEAVERSRTARREGEPVPPDSHLQNLAQITVNVAKRAGMSLAAFAKHHDLPYLALMKLVNTGVPPEETDVLDRLTQALAIGPEDFKAALEQSLDRPEPAHLAEANESATSPLQAALQAVISQKDLTMKAFAELSELSVITATKLVKHGALPSRSTTHAKLRNLLGLDEAEYAELVKRSKSGQPDTDTIVADEEFQHRETEEIMPDSAERGALAPRRSDGVDLEILDLVGRLDDRKRQALKQFLRTLL